MAITGDGNFPNKSAWVLSPRHRASKFALLYRNSALTSTDCDNVFRDWFFEVGVNVFNVTVTMTKAATFATSKTVTKTIAMAKALPFIIGKGVTKTIGMTKINSFAILTGQYKTILMSKINSFSIDTVNIFNLTTGMTKALSFATDSTAVLMKTVSMTMAKTFLVTADFIGAGGGVAGRIWSRISISLGLRL